MKKAVRVLIAGAIIAAVAVGFYLIGYEMSGKVKQVPFPTSICFAPKEP